MPGLRPDFSDDAVRSRIIESSGMNILPLSGLPPHERPGHATRDPVHGPGERALDALRNSDGDFLET